MKIQEVINYLNNLIPTGLQESYDNSGLLLGDTQKEISGVLISLDLCPEVIDEAIEKKCNLIVNHHPFIFSGIKRITPTNTTGKMIYKLIENGISVYAAHTNLDNLKNGVNAQLSEKLNLVNTKILSPMENTLKELTVYCPSDSCEKLKLALFEAGAGTLGNYDHCAYSLEANGTFKALPKANPHCGKIDKLYNTSEQCIKMIYPEIFENKILTAIIDNHPYETPAYSCISLTNSNIDCGAGMIGELPASLNTEDFLSLLKQKLDIPMLRHSAICKNKIKKVALCGGSGAFLIENAIQNNADIFLTGDLKYHDFQKAENKIIIADIGHYESEQFANEFFYYEISKKFSTFAVWISNKKSNFVNYI